MLIVLAYPYDGHAPDETIDVADQVGRQMVHDGAARLPDPDTVEHMTVVELRAYAAEHDIDLGGATKKADVAEAIRAAEEAAIPPQSPITPLSGTTTEET